MYMVIVRMEISTISISYSVSTCASSKLWCIVQNMIIILQTNYTIFSSVFVLPNVISYKFKYYIEKALKVIKAAQFRWSNEFTFILLDTFITFEIINQLSYYFPIDIRYEIFISYQPIFYFYILLRVSSSQTGKSNDRWIFRCYTRAYSALLLHYNNVYKIPV